MNKVSFRKFQFIIGIIVITLGMVLMAMGAYYQFKLAFVLGAITAVGVAAILRMD